MNGESTDKQELQTKTIIILDGEVQEGQPAVDKTEATSFNDEGLKEAVLIRLKYASGCRHIIHTAAEMGAVCSSCHRILCAACSKEEDNFCAKCRKAVCGCLSCRKKESIDGERKMVCAACHSWFRWDDLPALLKWLVIGLAGFLLLNMLLR